MYFIIILFLEWLYKHPALRYGGYSLIGSLVGIYVANFIYKYDFNYREIMQKSLILVIVSYLVFFGRNIHRLHKEYKQYAYEPFKSVFYKLNDDHFRIEKEITYLKASLRDCKKEKNNCIKNNILINYKKNRLIISKVKKN